MNNDNNSLDIKPTKPSSDLNTVLPMLIWSTSDTLRGLYRPPEYRRVILPLVVLVCFDLILSPYAKQMKELYEANENVLEDDSIRDTFFSKLLSKEIGLHRKQPLYNTSGYNLSMLLEEPDEIAANLINYIEGFSQEAHDVFVKFHFKDEIQNLAKNKLLYRLLNELVSKIKPLNIDVQNLALLSLKHSLADVFEDIVLRFNELSNETVGEHSTPRDVIDLMASVTFELDLEVLQQTKRKLKIYDPVVGMGTILSRADKYLRELNLNISTELFGEDINSEAYAICCASMIIRDQPVDNIIIGNTLNNDASKYKSNNSSNAIWYQEYNFDYMLANPPYSYDWKKISADIKEEAAKGNEGRFSAGLPRTSDGSLLFLQHMISKMNPSPEEGGEGSRISVVFNGSPLFVGDAGSGESNIRRWIIENDWLEAVIALPDQLYYNTGINTYIWVLSNKKPAERKGKVQLIDATDHYQKLRKSLGSKKKELGREHIEELIRIYKNFNDGEISKLITDNIGKPKVCSKVLNNKDFSYIKLLVERPLRLNFRTSDERIARLDDERAFANLVKNNSSKGSSSEESENKSGIKQQLEIKNALKTIDSSKVFKNRDEFENVLKPILNELNFKVSSVVKKAILNALSEKDPSAEVCIDKQGDIETDSELRDYEQMHLPDSIQLPLTLSYQDQDEAGQEEFVEMIRPYSEEYLKNKVLPYAPDAWIDYSRARIGYEISFNRYFFVDDSQPRDIKVIEAEIAKLETRVKEIFDRSL